MLWVIGNKTTDVKINGENIYSLIKNLDKRLTQKERIRYIEELLNGRNKEELTKLYESCKVNLVNTADSLYEETQIGCFFNSLANYILYSPEAEKVNKKTKLIFLENEEFQKVSKIKTVNIDNDMLVMNKRMLDDVTLMKSLQINDSEIYSLDFVPNKVNSMGIDQKEDFKGINVYDHSGLVEFPNKLENLIKLYSSYQNQIKGLQQAIDFWTISNLSSIKTRNSRLYITYDKINKKYILKKDDKVIFENSMFHFVDNEIKKINEKENFDDFLKVINTEDKNNINLNNYKKLMYEKKYDFEFFKLDKISKDKEYQAKVNKIISQLRSDMLIVKTSYYAILPSASVCFEHRSEEDIENEENPFEHIVDFLDKTHIEALLGVDYNQHTGNSLDYTFKNIKSIINSCKFNSLELNVLAMLRIGRNINRIAKYYNTSYDNIRKLYQNIVNNIYYQAVIFIEDYYYTYIVKGNYKKCTRCEEVKLISRFGLDSSRKDGLVPYCKECRKDI